MIFRNDCVILNLQVTFLNQVLYFVLMVFHALTAYAWTSPARYCSNGARSSLPFPSCFTIKDADSLGALQFAVTNMVKDFEVEVHAHSCQQVDYLAFHRVALRDLIFFFLYFGLNGDRPFFKVLRIAVYDGVEARKSGQGLVSSLNLRQFRKLINDLLFFNRHML